MAHKIMASIWVLPVIVSILIFALVLSQNTEALRSEGNSLTEVSSKKVCGTSLCDEPMSIAEKISLYLQKLSGSESTVLQQALDPRFRVEEPLKVKPGTMPLRESLSIKQLEPTQTPETGEIAEPIKLRESIPATSSKIPSAEKSIGEIFSSIGLSEPIGLPCVGCVTTEFIAAGAVGASEIAADAVGASEIAANAVRASEIAVRAVGASELNMSIKSFSAYNKDGGIQTREVQMVPNNGKNFCGLVKVKMENLDNSVEFDSVKTALGALIGTVGGPLGILAGGAAGTAASLAAGGAATLITSSGGVKIVSDAIDAANFIAAMSGNEAAECDIDVGGRTHWVLQASLSDPNKDANVYCQAICISYP